MPDPFLLVKQCEMCGTEYTATRSTSRYHSEACKKAAQRARPAADLPLPAHEDHLLSLFRLDWARREVEAVLARAQADGDGMGVLRAVDRLLAISKRRQKLWGWGSGPR